MRKDSDGFMDVEWCISKPLESWDDLRSTFKKANARKAISPTQFNHQSTRGHCIMVLEVEMPNPDNPNVKQRGRLYVCDLAGTEVVMRISFDNFFFNLQIYSDAKHIYVNYITASRRNIFCRV